MVLLCTAVAPLTIPQLKSHHQPSSNKKLQILTFEWLFIRINELFDCTLCGLGSKWSFFAIAKSRHFNWKLTWDNSSGTSWRGTDSHQLTSSKMSNSVNKRPAALFATEHMPINALCNCSSPTNHPPRKRSPAGQFVISQWLTFSRIFTWNEFTNSFSHALALSNLQNPSLFGW